jgi:hypothetical protein
MLSALYWRAWIAACVLALAASTPALADNTKAENDAANAAVMYLTAAKKCNNLSAIQLGADRPGARWQSPA